MIQKKITGLFWFGLIVGISLLVFLLGLVGIIPLTPTQPAAATLAVSSPFSYLFKIDGTLHETGTLAESSSPYWWLNSGGKLILASSTGMTIQGGLSSLDKWRLLYAKTNPRDTDNGLHPQNLFRLVSRSTWGNVRAEAYFRIKRDNISTSENRNQSNGLLVMSRYAVDGQTLYYAGLRVDGHAVIKKKYHGIYYTMAEIPVFGNDYNRDTKPNLLPHNEWIGIRSETKTNPDGSVRVALFYQREGQTTWTKVLEAIDSEEKFNGTAPITEAGHVGVRTDFMDVEFKSFRFEKI